MTTQATPPAPEPTMQPFEAYPKLAGMIENLGWKTSVSISTWGAFLDELNNVLRSRPQAATAPEPTMPYATDARNVAGHVDALLSGLKVGRLPDGKHFPSDAAAVISFAKWYARFHQPAATMPTPMPDREAMVDCMCREQWRCAGYFSSREGPRETWDEALAAGNPETEYFIRKAGISADAILSSPTPWTMPTPSVTREEQIDVVAGALAWHAYSYPTFEEVLKHQERDKGRLRTEACIAVDAILDLIASKKGG